MSIIWHMSRLSGSQATKLYVTRMPMLWLTLWIAVLAGMSSPLDAKITEDNVSPAQLEKLKEQIKDIDRWLNEAKSSEDKIRLELRKDEKRISQLARQIRGIQKDITKAASQVQKLRSEQKNLERQLAEQQEYIRRQIVSAYSLGQQPALKLLLNQQSPELIDRAVTYYDYINRARAEQIDQFRDTMNQLATTRSRLIAKETELKKSREQLTEQRTQLAASQKQRNRTLARLQSNIKNKSVQRESLTRDQQQLERLLEEVERAVRAIPLPAENKPFAKQRAKLPWPTRGKVKARFGTRLAEGKLKRQGVVIGSKADEPVVSVHYGRVVFSDWIRGYGLVVIVDHGDGYMSLYGQNKSLLRDAGEWVRAGEQIAITGGSGDYGDSGLYFEIRKNGKPQNPLRWLRKS